MILKNGLIRLKVFYQILISCFFFLGMVFRILNKQVVILFFTFDYILNVCMDYIYEQFHYYEALSILNPRELPLDVTKQLLVSPCSFFFGS